MLAHAAGGRLGHIIDIGRRAHQRMHQPRVGIRADVRLHAEAPWVAFLVLASLGGALSRLVLGRAGRGDDRGVHDSTLAHQQPFLGELRVDGLKDRRSEVLLLQQTAAL